MASVRLPRVPRPLPLIFAIFAGGAASALTGSAHQDPAPRFTSATALVNVTATVTDDQGRFVEDLRREDFAVFEDDVPQSVSVFTAGTVPVSLGLVVDASASMNAERLGAARAAVERLLSGLGSPGNEVFLLAFASTPRLLQDWTHDTRAIAAAAADISASGGTALFDAVGAALPLAARGAHRKKALVVISDGNDTSSTLTAPALRARILETDVLVYALGIDGTSRSELSTPPRSRPRFPIGRRPVPPRQWPGAPLPRGLPPVIIEEAPRRVPAAGDRLNADTLRRVTDDTGGRTEVVRGVRGLERATARLADELSRQYSLGYVSSLPADGKWHALRVEVRSRKTTVRARRGFVALPG